MQLYLLILLGALVSGCAGIVFPEPYVSNSPAWHDKYAKRLYGSWTDEPGYVYGHKAVNPGR